MPAETQCCTSKLISDSARANLALEVQLPSLVITDRAKQRNAELLACGTGPLTIHCFHPCLTLSAPGIRSRFLRVSRPEESNRQASMKAEHDMLADEGLGLWAVSLALYCSRIGHALSNESRLSCGALKKNSFPNLRAPPASSAC